MSIRSLCSLNRWLLALGVLATPLATPAPAFARLQCVPDARDVSGIAIHGNAHTW
ncbi:hypothetical protein [Novosphingobium sp. HR1a]|uniref:hypothetical protein n=1 Tax=Novosphingobium sp. HR1a TaxID=1395637 RepID=UPI001B3C9281|nr:hypothetical protein [Novosphingobium sp. HR1a]